jgi:thiol peroxidase
MAKVTLQGNEFDTVGSLPSEGSQAPDFTLVGADLKEIHLSDFAGKRLVLNIFPSVDTPVCAQSVRHFNQALANLDNTEVLCVSADLPFAQSRFCGAEDLTKVATASSFRSTFGHDYGVACDNGPLQGLLSRAVVVVNEHGAVTYTEQVGEIAAEPDYDQALASLS